MSNLMLVSADRELARVLKHALRDTSARVAVECTSARQAQNQFAAAAAGLSLIVLDLFLPESSGLEMLKTLKRINESGVFLLLNRMRTRTTIERAFRLGAHDVLEYPVSPDVLRDTILHRLAAEPLPEDDAEAPDAQAQKPARKK